MKQQICALLLLCSTLSNALKLDRVIIATDANPEYIEFWPVVAKTWKELIGLTPTLALIAHKDVYVDESLGEVIRIEPIEGIPTSLQAQTVRLLLPALFPEDVCIISDIDMIPLSRAYFMDSVAPFSDDSFIVYRDKAYDEHDFRFPMCYVAAKGKVFKEVFNVHSLTDIRRIITYWYSFNLGWHTDELMLYRYLTQWAQYEKKCIKLGHTLQDIIEKRIDRMDWVYNAHLLKVGYYVDVHCPRPYSKYKDEIDTIVTTKQNVIEKE